MEFCYCDICGCVGGDCNQLHPKPQECSCGEEPVNEIKEITTISLKCEVCEHDYHPNNSCIVEKGGDLCECTSIRYIGQERE